MTSYLLTGVISALRASPNPTLPVSQLADHREATGNRPDPLPKERHDDRRTETDQTSETNRVYMRLSPSARSLGSINQEVFQDARAAFTVKSTNHLSVCLCECLCSIQAPV